eukprot:gb/GFBE01032679.1/.p1 GENE.gb/GFBE01032679.1/~~gb/GFBE01032679.1/.p1  ORF type:complete len:146 (+),score=11.03 gb/GFBE01032679.1/:1-438(+)
MASLRASALVLLTAALAFSEVAGGSAKIPAGFSLTVNADGVASQASPAKRRKQAPELATLAASQVNCTARSETIENGATYPGCPSEMEGEEECLSKFFVDQDGTIKPCNWFIIGPSNPPNCDWDGLLSCDDDSKSQIIAQREGKR